MAIAMTLNGDHARSKMLSGEQMRPVAMIECRVCGASNHTSREGCFNCGSLLRVAWEEAKEFTLWVAEKLMPARPEHHVPQPPGAMWR